MVLTRLDQFVVSSDCYGTVVTFLVWQMVWASSSLWVNPIIKRLVFEMGCLSVKAVETFLMRSMITLTKNHFLDYFLFNFGLTIRTMGVFGMTTFLLKTLGIWFYFLLSLIKTIQTFLIRSMVTLSFGIVLIFNLKFFDPEFKPFSESRKFFQSFVFLIVLKIDSIIRDWKIFLISSELAFDISHQFANSTIFIDLCSELTSFIDHSNHYLVHYNFLKICL